MSTAEITYHRPSDEPVAERKYDFNALCEVIVQAGEKDDHVEQQRKAVQLAAAS